MNVAYYVNGKRVTKDEIKNIEIQKESAKRILSDKLTENKGSKEELK